MKKLKTFYFLILVMLFSTLSRAQNEEFRRAGTNVNYDLDDWVTFSSTRWITSLAEGREYIYFGTTGGISRYNFYSQQWDRPWTVSDGLADSYILTVAYDLNTDFLWCSTQVGVSVFRTIWQRWENVYEESFGMYADDDIVSIGFDNSDVWLESKNGYYFKAANQQTSFYQESGGSVPHGQIKWFGQRAVNTDNMPELFMRDGYFFDSNGIIKDIHLDDYPVTCFATDHWNTIWVGSWGAGAGKADARIKTLEMMPQGLFKKNVNGFEIDEYGNIWAGGIGTYNGQSGITYWDIENETYHYYQASLNMNIYNDQVTSIALDEPNVWFGTEYGLLRYHAEKNEWKSFDSGHGLRDNYILDVEVDEKSVWIATLLGLCQLDKRKMYEKDFHVTDVAESDILNMKVYDIEIMGNLLWIGTEYGVYVYDKNTKSGGFEYEAGGPQNNEVTAVGVLRDKEVWFGMESGIEVYDIQNKKWKGVPERRFNQSMMVNYIVVDDSAAWVGTDQGVMKFDKTRKRWRTFDMEDGLPDNRVNYIVLDGDFVWFGTPEGLTRFYWNSPYRID